MTLNQTRSQKKELPKSELFRMDRGSRKYAHQMTKPELFTWMNDSWKMLKALDRSPYSSPKLKANLVKQVNALWLYFDEAFPGWRKDLGIAEGQVLML